MKGKAGRGDETRIKIWKRRKVLRILAWKADLSSEHFLCLIFSEGL